MESKDTVVKDVVEEKSVQIENSSEHVLETQEKKTKNRSKKEKNKKSKKSKKLPKDTVKPVESKKENKIKHVVKRDPKKTLEEVKRIFAPFDPTNKITVSGLPPSEEKYQAVVPHNSGKSKIVRDEQGELYLRRLEIKNYKLEHGITQSNPKKQIANEIKELEKLNKMLGEARLIREQLHQVDNEMEIVEQNLDTEEKERKEQSIPLLSEDVAIENHLQDSF
ncbi:hypothetical protein WA158_002721 [Blastocystis sp. Blastoise]